MRCDRVIFIAIIRNFDWTSPQLTPKVMQIRQTLIHSPGSSRNTPVTPDVFFAR
jgi:hypothetical protein